VVVDAEVPQPEQDHLDLRGHDLLMSRPGFGRGIRGGRRGRETLLFLRLFLLLARAAASSPKRRGEKAGGFAPKAQEAEGDGERGRRCPDLHLSGEEEEGGRQAGRSSGSPGSRGGTSGTKVPTTTTPARKKDE
jgi:hypothetical protein